MENSARYTLIGAFALACLVAAFSFVYWIKNVGGLGQRALYEIRFEQPVSGLAIGSSVLFNGVRAGAVTRIALDPNAPRACHHHGCPRSGNSGPRRHGGGHFISGADRRFSRRAERRRGGLAAADGEQRPAAADHRGPRCRPQPDRSSAQETLRHIDGILDQNAKPLNTAITGIAAFADMLGRNSQRLEGLIGGLENLTGSGTPKAGPPSTT